MKTLCLPYATIRWAYRKPMIKSIAPARRPQLHFWKGGQPNEISRCRVTTIDYIPVFLAVHTTALDAPRQA
jgi:hypothetical protein